MGFKYTPVKVSLMTVGVIYLLPSIISLIVFEKIPLPYFFTRTAAVDKIPLIIAILVFVSILFFVYVIDKIKIKTPVFCFSVSIRYSLMAVYFLLSAVSVYVMARDLEYFNRLQDNPALAMLSFGALLPEEKLLFYFFLGSLAPIVSSLLNKNDSIILRCSVYTFVVTVTAFYVTLGRREVALMMLIMIASNYISGGSFKKILVSVIALLIAGGFLLLRSDSSLQDQTDIFNILYETTTTIIEELSPLPISAYVISIGGLQDNATFINGILPTRFFETDVSKSISSGFFGRVSSNSGTGPVVGVVATTLEYGFIFPMLLLFILTTLCSWSWNMYKHNFGDHWRVISIFFGFKIFNLLRNGEFAIVYLDIMMFVILVWPLLITKFPGSAKSH